jgi:putative SOS response-associated peptidase YedK
MYSHLFRRISRLREISFRIWERGDVRDAAALMKPAGDGALQKWPVSKRVNSSRADASDATLIEKISA